ncbi:glutamate racemase [Methylobacillus gramineus]|uniref:glutamate racemase n=1 Tax=Methylobacillus gramineus TaxID=755169 RepID=UPI001D000501|nr:glutamate racemase [Methylobacillus gramineus]MCB5185076.1 glutamate racemase [Methylobacillus gramineus]
MHFVSATNSAIGIFDSGVGGISVLRHIRSALPHEHLAYYADSHFAPYGTKSPEMIAERSFYLADFLIRQAGVKALVVACNTATAAAVGLLRQHYSLPVIGMEPAVKPAVLATKTGVVGVLATSGTLKSAQFAALLESYGQDIQIVTQAGHGLVECVERGELDNESVRHLLRQYLEPLLAQGVDTLVLGCTHYPFLSGAIREIVGNDVTLIETGAAVAKQLGKRLHEHQLLNAGSDNGQVSFFSNQADAVSARGVIAALWNEPQENWTFTVQEVAAEP